MREQRVAAPGCRPDGAQGSDRHGVSAGDGLRWARDRLARRAVLTGPITRCRVTSGPMMDRIALSSAADEHLMLDVPHQPSVIAPAFVGSAMDRLVTLTRPVPTDPPATGPLISPVPAEPLVAGGLRAWFHRTPWPPAMLAEVVTGAVETALPAPEVFAGLGALLARVHASGLAVGYRPMPPLARALAAATGLTPDQRAAATRILDTTDPVVHVHGQPALGHVLVPAVLPNPGVSPNPGMPPDPTVPPDPVAAAVLTGWTDRLGGSAALDLGHLLGDITEIAVLISTSDRMRAHWLDARITDVRDGYRAAAGSRGLDGTFWDRVADGAVLRVLDHRATLCRLLHPDSAPVRLADRVFAHLTSSAFREKGFRP